MPHSNILNMSITRRTFIKNTSLTFAAISVANTSLFANASDQLTGIQLYSIRDAMKADPLGTLKILAEQGFKNVEHANYNNRKFTLFVF